VTAVDETGVLAGKDVVPTVSSQSSRWTARTAVTRIRKGRGLGMGGGYRELDVLDASVPSSASDPIGRTA
jgi:hypothetical protein